MSMSERFRHYLRREQARLESLIDRERARPVPDQLLVTRLRKLARHVREQISELEEAPADRQAA